MLISGKKGLGKFTLINHFLNYVFSKDTYNFKEKIINEDSKVYKSQLNGIFHNILHIKNEGRKKTKIDDVRNLKTILSQSTINGNLRFIILDDVEKLNTSSSNALLKILEEPPKNVFFFIINNNKRILPTIKSRSHVFKFFLTLQEKQIIYNKIMQDYNINNNLKEITKRFYFDTPGNLIKYSLILSKYNIDLNNDIYNSIIYLIDSYKKDKNIELLNFIFLY